MANQIHPTAIIDKSVVMGDNVFIGPYCIVGPDIQIDNNVWIQSHVRVDKNTKIAEDCKIFHGASVGQDPQDLKYQGEHSILTIGPRTVIREFATLHRGSASTGKTVVGSDCLFMNFTHVPHDCVIGNHAIISNAVQIAGHVELGDHVTIGGVTGVHQFVRIGSHCMVGFGLRVNQDIPPYLLAAGEPIRPAGVNKVGLSRRGFSQEDIAEIKKVYRIIYDMNLTISDALDKIKSEMPESPFSKNIVEFIEKSERGIIR